jgi:hypothetical protein
MTDLKMSADVSDSERNAEVLSLGLAGLLRARLLNATFFVTRGVSGNLAFRGLEPGS